MVTPAAGREAVAHLQITFEVSERRVCTALGPNRPASDVAPRPFPLSAPRPSRCFTEPMRSNQFIPG
jgi:hypothetical protein